MTVMAENPLREGLSEERRPDPCTLVIFGASGDLTRRKLLPALYSLYRDQLLPENFAVVGFARSAKEREVFAEAMKDGCDAFARRRPVDGASWSNFAGRLYYVAGNFDQVEDYKKLHQAFDKIDEERGTKGNRIFYLATPPDYFEHILTNLGASGLVTPPSKLGPTTRVIIEKPFGHDLASARHLNEIVHTVFDESQVYRIDHYLGKETVQNILVFRFGNGIFEPVWNQKYVDHVELTVAESIGVEGRGNYFETAGILRDIVQNHMLQFLALTAMEPPVAFEADAVRDEKVKVLRTIRLQPPAAAASHSIRAQYAPGSISGAPVPGYREESGVAHDSKVETYVALRLYIDNWRWAGVPFYLRAGKRLPKRVSEIAIHFKSPPHTMFRSVGQSMLEPNLLSMRIQPDEGIALKFDSKVPGPTVRIRPVNMEFRYGTSFGQEPPEAYERLILDCMLGDSTLFTRSDEIEAAWKFISGIHEGWEASNSPVASYPAGSWGPKESDQMLLDEGHEWRRL